jgi:hypothetical protein
MTDYLSLIVPQVFAKHRALNEANADGELARLARSLFVAILSGDMELVRAVHATLGLLLEPDPFNEIVPAPWSPALTCLHAVKCFNADPWACHKDSRQFNGKGRRPWRCSCGACHDAFVAQKHREQAAERRRRIKARSTATW